MPTFEGRHRHDAFVAWLGRHRADGYVLNYSFPTPGTNYLILHMGNCPDLWRAIDEGKSMTDKYGKRCSTDRRELEHWVADHVSGATVDDIHHCEHCFR